jgi:LPS export ABC transporter protein LptC
MYRRANNLLCFLITAAAVLLLFSTCTNDLKKIQAISAQLVNSPVDTTKGVDVIMSDSAKVKVRLLTPLMLDYQISKDNKQEYKLMPKGVKIIFFDKNHQESANIIADSAYYYQSTELIKLRKHVVLTSAKGDVFKSEELTWDRVLHKITSTKPVDLVMANGNIGHGTSMETNEKFNPLTVQNQTGMFYIDSKTGQ